MFPERAEIRIYLVISFAVNAFESVRIQFLLFHFKSKQVDFEVCLATPCEVSVIFTFVWSIIFNVFQTLISV